jgi:EmrB/QacA subfamily drug resistance transporter
MSLCTCQFLHVNELASLSRRRRTLLWLAVLSGLLLAMLDQTIVGTALPQIVRDLGGESWYVWGITAYLVPATVLLPVFARLSDRYGRQRMLLVGMSLFVLGSALCAIAQSMGQVATFRAVQGAGAAALEALSFLLVAELSGPRRNAAAQAVLAGIMAFSFIAGPMIGGLLTDHVGWRWVFLVNVPLGLLAIAVVTRVLPAELGRSQGRETPLDIAGIAVLTASLGLVLVGLNQHLLVSSWFAVRTGGLVVAGLVGVGLLVLVERRAASPVLPLRLLTQPLMARLLVTGATATFGLYACVMLLPRYYQQTQGVSATRSGVFIYPLLLGLLIAVNLGAAVIARRDAFRGTLLVANGAVALGAVGFIVFDASSPAALPLLLMALIGVGVGPNLSGLQIAVQRSVAPMDLGAAMGALLLGRQLGGALALAAAETVYVGRLRAGATTEAATGWSIFVVAAAGAAVAAIALLTLRRGADRIPAPTTYVLAGDVTNDLLADGRDAAAPAT